MAASLRERLVLPYKVTRVPLSIYFIFSTITAILLAIGGWRQVQLPGEEPPYTGWFVLEVVDRYFGVVSNWDGGWYRTIAGSGYPSELPRNEDGTVLQNPWAFWPLYPGLVRLVMNLTGQSFDLSAWLVSAFCGGVATVVLYRFVRPRLGTFGAGAVVACLLAFPTAPILQVGYPESLALLLILLALLALSRRRYDMVSLAALALSLTRPVVLPMALVVAAHGLLRWWRGRGDGEGFPARERIQVVLTAAWCAVLSGLWPLLADLVVGERNVYLKTITAWSVDRTTVGFPGGWLNDVIHLAPVGIAGLAILLWTWYLALRAESRWWPAELRLWAMAYTSYIFAGTRPTPSIFRYLMLGVILVLPFVEVVAGGVQPRAARRWELSVLFGLIGLGYIAQYAWIMNVFTIAVGQDQQPFP